MRKYFLRIALMLLLVDLLGGNAFSQDCSTIFGQNPTSAIPVCGTTVFQQDGQASCNGVPNFPHIVCPANVTSNNSWWYKFHCYQTGTLGFIINGTIPGADYDWIVFDITGHDPNDVFTDTTLQISLNLYGVVDPTTAPFPNYPTGCTSFGVGNANCENETNPFNEMPVITVGHDYLLMVTNWNSSGIGYSLDLSGGTAVITDPVVPAIERATGSCNNLTINVKLNKKMKCHSMAPDGSDFKLNVAGVSIISAVSASCSANFDTDSLILTLNHPLPGGSYQLIAQLGIDGNTMLDYCNVPLPADSAVPLIIKEAAIADFNFNGTSCTDTDIIFTDKSTANAGIVNWHWDMGDGNVFDFSNGNVFTHQYMSDGIKNVTLTVTTDNACTNTITKIISIFSSPVLSFTNPPVCLPYGTANFTNTSTIPDMSPMVYNWDFGDPSSGINNTSTLDAPSHYFSAPGSYMVTLTATSTNSCTSSITLPVSNIYPQAHATFFPVPENCLGTASLFTSNANGNGSPISSYHWDFGDASTGTGTNLSYTYTTPGLKTIQHWAVTDKGCYSDTSNNTVYINQLPTPDFTYPSPGCQTRDINFADASLPNDGNVTKWEWDFGDISSPDNTSTLRKPTHIFALEGIYNVSLTVTTDKGCSNSVPFVKPVTINARPAANFIEPKVCVDDIFAQFTNNSTIVTGSITTWVWDFGESSSGPLNTSSLQNPTHIYSNAGPYDVMLITTSDNGCVDTSKKPISINGNNPVADLSLLNTGSICAKDIISIKDQSSVTPGNITRIAVNWDDLGAPGVFEIDNDPAIGKVYQHIYPDFQSPATKSFTIRFRAYSGSGEVCFTDKLFPVSINASPNIIFSTIPDTCLLTTPFNLTQAIEPNSIPGIGTYSGIGITDPVNGTFDPAIAGVGTHAITYTFTSLAGCTDTKSRSILVLDTASAKFTYAAPPACDGTPVTFTDKSIVPAGVVLETTTWDFDDGSAIEQHAPGSTFTHLFPGPRRYTVKMYNTSAYGCGSTATLQEVVVSPKPNTLFTFGETSVCIPNAVVSFINTSTISDGTENAFMYNWDLGDPASDPLNTYTAKTPPPHLYTGTGPYAVLLKVTSGAGCAMTYTDTVDFIHPQPKAVFVTDKKSVCLDENVLLTDITDPLDGTTVSWHWDMGDGIRPGTNIVDHHYRDTGTYRIFFYIINSHNCNSDTAEKTFNVYPYPIVNAGPDRRVLEGSFVKMQPTVSGKDLEYLWTPNMYFPNNRLLIPTAQYIKDDVTYRLTVTGRGGCPSSDDVFIKVLKNPRVPNIFTPNNDGINDKWVIQYLEEYSNCFVQVFTRGGQSVYESRGVYKPWNGTKFGNGTPLPFDTYYYIIEAGDGQDPVTGYVTIVK